MTSHLLCKADARNLSFLPDCTVQCCVTSPPYWGLRDYGTADQIGLEASPDDYVAAMVGVFREVKRVLRDDGTVWLNLGDSYATGAGKVGECPGGGEQGERWKGNRGAHTAGNSGKESYRLAMGPMVQPNRMPIVGLKPKDLVGIPWRVAFALQADGWYLRSDIIWAKPSPMPESVTDRPTKAHEYLFLLSKEPRYFYDLEAVREPVNPANMGDVSVVEREGGTRFDAEGKPVASIRRYDEIKGANRRSVWTIATQPFPGAHFATFPPKLIEPCIKAGTSERGCCPACGAPWVRVTDRTPVRRQRPNDFVKRTGAEGTGNSCANSVAGVAVVTRGWRPTCRCPGAEPVGCVVLDPFNGAGTTGVVSLGLGRRYIGLDLSAEYLAMARRRIERPHAPVPSLRDGPLPLFDREAT